ncbi:MAG: hypothetical protein AVDCRST_MAG77-683, partial [uncultured Chloroflexi bacterium]
GALGGEEGVLACPGHADGVGRRAAGEHGGDLLGWAAGDADLIDLQAGMALAGQPEQLLEGDLLHARDRV